MLVPVALVLLLVLPPPARPADDVCRPEYGRFSARHSACLPENPRCEIMKRGVDEEERELILRLHNEYRSKVATGSEARGGGMPSASNMMEMVWDDELTDVAQKWAENCVYKHDCPDCRKVDSYSTGQNIAFQDKYCASVEACAEAGVDVYKTNWPKVLDFFYNEVEKFEKRLLTNWQETPSKNIGHFSQIEWAHTWRIGCGFTLFMNGPGAFRQFYVCDYGPGGNVIQERMYKFGPPCSECPANTCCGSSCGGYDGLCRMKGPDEAPIPKRDMDDYIFFCDFGHTEECSLVFEGSSNWETKENFHGKYNSITLQPGQLTRVTFEDPVVPSGDQFCVVTSFQKGAAHAGQSDVSELILELQPEGSRLTRQPLDIGSPNFGEFTEDFLGSTPTTVSLAFKVPKGTYPHVLDIDKVYAVDGPCNKRPDQSL